MCVCVCVGRLVLSDSVIPWTIAHWAPLFMGFSRQEYWSWLPFPFPGGLPNPGMEPRSPALQADFLTLPLGDIIYIPQNSPFFKMYKIFLCLAVPGLNCSM